MIFVAAVLAMVAPAAHAETAVPDSDNGRFTFNQVQDGLLRLDTRTGQVSLCSKHAVGWACQAVPDERSALEAEIGRLQGENASLKKEMLARGVPLPSGSAASRAPEIELKLPSDAELDRMMTFVEKVWRRLMGIVQSLQKEIDRKG